PVIEGAGPGVAGAGATVAGACRGRHPGSWRVTFDRRAGRPGMVEGEGIPFLPGRGNGLTPRAAGLAGATFDMAEVEALGRALIEREAAMLRPDVGDLRLSPERSGSFDDGVIWFLDFDWYVNDVPVEGARVFLRVN